MRVLLYTGKGGVGKTTLASASALEAARRGRRVFLLSADPAHSLSGALGLPLGHEPREVAPGLVAREFSTIDELDQAWATIESWLAELLVEDVDGFASEELFAFPGLEELVALRAIREVEATGDYDLCVVDCAPTGATLRMLRLPDVLRFYMESVFDWKRRGARALRPWLRRLGAGSWVPGEEVFDAALQLYEEIADVREILLDEARTSARLVLTPSRVVLAEARRAFAYLSLYGVATDAVVVNGILPEEAADPLLAGWRAKEKLLLQEIEDSFPVAQLRASRLSHEPIGTAALAELGRRVFTELDPAARLHEGRPIRVVREEGRSVLRIELPFVGKDEVDVARAGSDLCIRVRDTRRLVALPDSLSGREILGAGLDESVLKVVFAG